MDTATTSNHRVWDLLPGLALAGALMLIVTIDRILGPTGAEIIFIIDQRPVMKSLREAIRDRCLQTAQALDAQGLKCRFAVIPFGGHRSHLSAVELTGDMNVFRNQLQSNPGDAAPADATAVIAMERALEWNFRKGEPVVFYVISATPYSSADEVRGVSQRVAQRGIMTIIQTAAESQAACQPLLENGARLTTFEGFEIKGRSSNAGTQAASLVDKLSSQAGVPISVGGLYSGRTSTNRMAIVEKGGGTAESEAAVAAGLNWLARHQADDGHWSDHDKCETEACPKQSFTFSNQDAAYAETGLAILAFQAGGHYDFNRQPYSTVVGRGLDWLVENQKDDGTWFSSAGTWYQHGIATFAMAEACAVAYANRHEPKPRYLYAAQRAIRFIEEHQYALGGWRYSLGNQDLGDTSVSGWQVLALKSAIEAEIPVAAETLERAKTFFERCGDEATGQTSYQPGGHRTELTTAVGLIFQHLIAKTPDSPFAEMATRYLATKAQQGIGRSSDYYTLYNGNLAMFLSGKEEWKTWNNSVREEILTKQVNTGCARGSWDGPHGHGFKHGRTLDTAWAILALEVYYRYSPESYAAKPER